jgi:hypothetical protein
VPWAYIWAAAAWLAIGGGAGYVWRAGTTPTSAAQFEQPAATAIPQRAFPGAKVNYSGNGTYAVPGQAPPGEYTVTAGGSPYGCTWARLSATDGKPKNEIDAGTVVRGGLGQFTVASGDRALKMQGDCWWYKQ